MTSHNRVSSLSRPVTTTTTTPCSLTKYSNCRGTEVRVSHLPQTLQQPIVDPPLSLFAGSPTRLRGTKADHVPTCENPPSRE